MNANDINRFNDLVAQVNNVYNNAGLTIDQKFEMVFSDNLFGEIEKLNVDFEWYMPDIDDDRLYELDVYVKELNIVWGEINTPYQLSYQNNYQLYGSPGDTISTGSTTPWYKYYTPINTSWDETTKKSVLDDLADLIAPSKKESK